MGIESWVTRAAETGVIAKSAIATAESAKDGAQAAEYKEQIAEQLAPVTSPQYRPIVNCNPADIGERLKNTAVNLTNTASGRMLLVLEHEPTAAALDLLSAMLKAIDTEIQNQSLAIMTESTKADSLTTVAGSVQPALVVVMASLPDGASAAGLAVHRQTHYSYPWLPAPLAITLHPQALLDDKNAKRPAWEDLKRVKAFLDG